MIGYLRGQLLRIEPERALIDIQGVGYDVNIPLSTSYELQRAGTGAEVEVFVHTHVREDALQLFAFFTDLERRLFLRLIGISGIGPKLAQTILSGMPPGDLIAAISQGQPKLLHAISGVGKKTAERMVLELRDKLGDLAAEVPSRAGPVAASKDEDLVLALVNLGYKRLDAERAVARLEQEETDSDLAFADRLRTALRHLSKV